MTDYYPYGMDMPGRSYTAEAYRYGYQGSERDRNMQGGTGYTTFFRSLDPRLGRWLNPDPKKFPWQSPYCSMDCNPVALTDVMGAESGGGEGGGDFTYSFDSSSDHVSFASTQTPGATSQPTTLDGLVLFDINSISKEFGKSIDQKLIPVEVKQLQIPDKFPSNGEIRAMDADLGMFEMWQEESSGNATEATVKFVSGIIYDMVNKPYTMITGETLGGTEVTPNERVGALAETVLMVGSSGVIKNGSSIVKSAKKVIAKSATTEVAGKVAVSGSKEAIELHHLLPQSKEFKEFFKRAGLNVEDFKIPLDKATHRLKPDGVHTGPDSWNKVWRNFMKEYPNASKGQILEQLKLMRQKFGI